MKYEDKETATSVDAAFDAMKPLPSTNGTFTASTSMLRVTELVNSLDKSDSACWTSVSRAACSLDVSEAKVPSKP